jgi:small-conductance mechanosensitive channel
MVSKFSVVLVAFFVIMGIVYTLKSRINSVVEESTTRYRMRKAVTLIAYLIFVIITIATFKKDMSGFAVAIGVIAGGIAFALQEVIISIAGWLAITFSSFYRVGDRIKIGSIYGDVIDIGILRTTLMECGAWVNSDLYNGRIVRVTNSFIFKDPVYNYSGEFPFLWDEIILPIRYGSSVEYTRQTLINIADDVVGDFTDSVRESWHNLSKLYAVEDATIEPMVTIAATDNWIEFTLRYVVDFKKRRSTRDQLFTRFLGEAEKSEGKIQMASQTSEIVSFPKLQIHSDNIPENTKN